MTIAVRYTMLVVMMVAQLNCGDDGGGDVDEELGPIEDLITDFGQRINWPGVDRGGGREIDFIRGFGEGGPGAYWFTGFASRQTADSFWFCREGDDACPLDANERLNWDRLVGNPVFTRIPGQEGFSPFWQMWIVRVPADYEPNAIKTTATISRLANEGVVSVSAFRKEFGTRLGREIPPGQEVIMHCALVLTGTTLAENGSMMPDGSGPMRIILNHFGWHEGYKVEFVDFTPSDGMFPKAEDSENRPLMPFANIYIMWQHCEGTTQPGICDIPVTALQGERAISERGLGQDITNDGDTNDTNNTMGALPCRVPLREKENVYSPLWAINKVYVVDPSIQLIDSSADQATSESRSAADVFDGFSAGIFSEPVPQTEDESGNPVPGNEGQLFFNCPNPVREDYVPYPCEANGF